MMKATTPHALRLGLSVGLVAFCAATGFAQFSFFDGFDSATLDPAWTVKSGVGSISLTANPGYLRYTYSGSTGNDYDRPATWVYRSFTGTNWVFESHQIYFLPYGNGRQLITRIVFGGLAQRDTLFASWVRNQDVNGGNYITGVADPLGGSGNYHALWETESLWVRIVRNGQEVAFYLSADGVNYTQLDDYVMVTPLGSDQILMFSGADWAGDGLMDIDYAKLTPTAIPVTGRLAFLSYSGSAVPSATFEIRVPGQETTYSTVPLDSYGGFTVAAPIGQFELSVKESHWLRKTVSVDTRNGSQDVGTLDMVNGDAWDDNKINLLDLSTMLANFGSIGPDGDVDGSGKVNLFDLSIILANFNMRGDT